MTRKPTYKSPTKREADKHWQAQERSVFRAPGSRDPGVTLTPDAHAAQTVLEGEIQGPQHVFRLRTGATPIPDPMARARAIIAAWREGGTSDRVFAMCDTPLEVQLYLTLQGQMSDAQRTQSLAKISAQIFAQQKEAIAQQNREVRQETDAERNLLLAMREMRKAGKPGVE